MLIVETSEFEDGSVDFTKLNFLRVPVRLGMDAFKTGYISQEKTDMMVDPMRAFQLLMKIYQVEHFKACATAAMREAKNGVEVCHFVGESTGISIQIISGGEEAGIICETHMAEHMGDHQPYLYIDVGGGSTELLLFLNGQILFNESFNIGTNRLLNNAVSEMQMNDLKQFVKSHTKGLGDFKAIGSGGNINKLRSMSGIKD
jgi:exopolyphosphatase/guanosine-5'-triphosphate,3'-diphosphate pyrophosphatase